MSAGGGRVTWDIRSSVPGWTFDGSEIHLSDPLLTSEARVRLTRSPLRRAALSAAAAGLVAGVLLVPSIARAAAAPMSLANAGAAETLVAELGARSAGHYVDASGRMVVTVTDQSAAGTVRAAG